METTDFLIIGSGPGGALTAWELKNKKKVLLIESGSFHNLDSYEALLYFGDVCVCVENINMEV